MLFWFGDDVLTRKRGWRKRAGTRPVNGRRIKNTEGGGCQECDKYTQIQPTINVPSV